MATSFGWTTSRTTTDARSRHSKSLAVCRCHCADHQGGASLSLPGARVATAAAPTAIVSGRDLRYGANEGPREGYTLLEHMRRQGDFTPFFLFIRR